MALPQVVVDLLHFQPGLMDAFHQVLRTVHLGVAVGDGGKVERGHRQAEGRRLKALAVPKRLHDAYPRVGPHRLRRAAQDAHDLRLAEAVEKLAHPNHVGRGLHLGEARPLVEQVQGEAADSLRAPLAGNVAAHHLYLLWQVDYGHFHLRVEVYAAQRPFPSVAANVVEPSRVKLAEDDVEGCGKG